MLCLENAGRSSETATTPDGINSLLEVGFEYVCEKDGFLYFKKRR